MVILQEIDTLEDVGQSLIPSLKAMAPARRVTLRLRQGQGVPPDFIGKGLNATMNIPLHRWTYFSIFPPRAGARPRSIYFLFEPLGKGRVLQWVI
jgi:hypothetical protein